MTTKITANDIANWMTNQIDIDAGDSITHLKLQKLVYYAQAWALALLHKPLFEEDFQAWAHGPVAVSIFNRYSTFGWQALPVSACDIELDEETTSVLNEVWDAYGHMTGKELEKLTHSEMPWSSTRNGLPPEAKSNAVIAKDVIAEFYNRLYSEVSDEVSVAHG